MNALVFNMAELRITSDQVIYQYSLSLKILYFNQHIYRVIDCESQQ